MDMNLRLLDENNCLVRRRTLLVSECPVEFFILLEVPLRGDSLPMSTCTGLCCLHIAQYQVLIPVVCMWFYFHDTRPTAPSRLFVVTAEPPGSKTTERLIDGRPPPEPLIAAHEHVCFDKEGKSKRGSRGERPSYRFQSAPTSVPTWDGHA